MKRVIGIILIIVGIIWDGLVLWTAITLGGDRVGATVLFIVGILVIFLGRKLAKAK